MRLIVLQNDAMIADVICGTEAIYIGSREGSRVHLPDAQIAPQQAVVCPESDGSWQLRQLDTRLQVHVNGTVVPETARLKTGDEIRIQDYAIRVYPEYEEQPVARATMGTSRAQLERFAQASSHPGRFSSVWTSRSPSNRSCLTAWDAPT